MSSTDPPSSVLSIRDALAEPGRAESARQVLAGGGEMGALMRALDWSRTPVGSAEGWPQSLRTALSILLESRFGMMIAWGPEYTQFYNDPFRPILGETKHPALGVSARDTFPEAWHIVGPLFERVMRGESFAFEDMLVPLDRYGYLEECYFHYSYGPIRDERGQVGGVLVIVNETTPRVTAERRLLALRDLGSQAAHAAREGDAWAAAASVLAKAPLDVPFAFLYRLSPDGESASLAVGPASSLSPERLPLGGAQSGAGRWPLDVALAPGGVLLRDVLMRFGHHAGSAWPEPVREALVLPITRRGRGLPFGFLVAGISPRRSFDQKYRDFFELIADHIAAAVASARAFEHEQRRAEALAELDRQKTAFFSNVSHEFRTPLTLILGPVEEALGSPEAALPRDGLELVRRNAQRLSKLVTTLLDFARLEAGRAEARYEPIEAGAFTAAIASSFMSLVEGAGLTLTIHCPPLVEPAYLDPDMWEKIVLNLLSNAFKFTFEGGIEVSTVEEAGQLLLTVADTGTGIPASELPHLFERFRRIEGARGRTHEGSGIGLAMVRELVRLHGGSVEVESQLGAGSRFTVRVPLGAAHLPADRVHAEPRAERSSAASLYLHEGHALAQPGALSVEPSSAALREAASAHLLVVDDNADMRDYVARLLRAEGYSVETASDGQAALERALQQPPDLIVADVMMPRLGGFGLLHELKRAEATRHLPVILLSARAGDDAAGAALLEGADDYLVKPFAARELVSRVAARLEIARAHAQAAHARERLRAQLMQAPVAVAILAGPELRYELANARYVEITGGRPLLGRSVRDVFPELPADTTLFRILHEVYATGTPFAVNDFRLPLDRGGSGQPSDAFFNFTCQPLRDDAGEIVELMVVALDVTAEVHARRRIESLLSELQLADQRKNEFLATLAHELRNPMAAISSALSLLDTPAVDAEKAARYRELARRQTTHLVRLVDDLLDVARITRGTIELVQRHVDLRDVVEHAVLATRPSIEAHHHALSVDLGSEPCPIYADATRIEQVVINLLTNAAKYTAPGGHVAISLRREPGAPRAGASRGPRPERDDPAARAESAVLRVRDTGRGIPPDMLDKVFDLFTQVSPTIDRSTGGLGLGLTLVKHLTETHGGQALATSDGPGRGTEFIIRLPIMAKTQPTSPSGEPAPAPASSKRNLRVLVVEDSEDVRELLAECLQSLGHEVFAAADGPEGAERFASVQPDVAFVDVGLPGIDGYELARRIRAEPGGKQARLVALTGYGGAEVKREAERAGFDVHLTKPVDIQGLCQVLESCEPRQRG